MKNPIDNAIKDMLNEALAELENKLKKLEQRIVKLENGNNKSNFPDNSMYML